MPNHRLSADCEQNRERLRRTGHNDFFEITNQFTPPVVNSDDCVIDGLFGAGLKEPLTGGFASLVRYINESGAFVIPLTFRPDYSANGIPKHQKTVLSKLD